MEERRVIRAFVIYYILLIISISFYGITNGNSAAMYAGYCMSFVFIFLSLMSYPYIVNKKLFIWGLLLFVSGFITLIINIEHVFDSVKSIGVNINVIIPFLYMLILGYISVRRISLNAINRVLYFYSLVCLVVSLMTIIINYNQLSSIFAFSSNAYMMVLKGFFPNKNMFGNFVAIGAVISVYNLCISKSKFSIITVIILSLITIISFSRAAILFLGLFCVFFGLSSLKKNTKEFKKLRYLIALALICAVAVFFMVITNDAFKDFIFFKILRLDIGDAGRTSIHSMAEDLLAKNNVIQWLFGYGASGLDYRIKYDLHNTYLNILLTGGVIKLVLYLFGILYAFSCCKKIENDMMRYFCIGCLFSYLIYSFFETVVFFELGLFHFLIFFIILFIPLSLKKTIEENEDIRNYCCSSGAIENE